MEEGEAAVLPRELVGAVDAAVARVAQRGLVGAAEDGGRLGRAHVALHLHRWPWPGAAYSTQPLEKAAGQRGRGSR